MTVGYAITGAGFDVLMIESDGEGNEATRALLARPGNDRGAMIVEREAGGYEIAGTLAGADTVGDFTVMWQPR